jgi:hypothetical protein
MARVTATKIYHAANRCHDAATMAISRALYISVDAPYGRCSAVELAVEQNGDILNATVISHCDKRPVEFSLLAPVCHYHRELLLARKKGDAMS